MTTSDVPADSEETTTSGETDEDLLNVSRRGFLAGSSSLLVGLFAFPGELAADQSVVEGLTDVDPANFTPKLFVTVKPDDTVELVSHRSEMGQQIWTSLAQILVEELEADWDQIEVTQAEGHPKFGDQNTDGSRSIRYNFTRFRKIGAAIRDTLERAAAQEWNASAADCRAERGVVRHAGSDRAASFGELAEAARQLEVPSLSEVEMKDRSDWRSISTPKKSLIAPSVVNGEGEYAQDLAVEGMKVAVVARPPQVLGRPKAVDDSAAMEVPGVEKTVRFPDLDEPVKFKPLGGVAVVAENTWAAQRGREALEIEWEAGPNADYDSDEFAASLMETARQDGEVRRNRGDVDGALEEAETTVDAEYYVPHLAHTAMEPPAALARWRDGSVECWGCVQAPQSARSTVASYCDVDKENVAINVTWLGGGFGRKSKPDFVTEAEHVEEAVPDVATVARAEHWSEGRSQSIEVGARALPDDVASVLVVGVDQPLLTRVLRPLLDRTSTPLVQPVDAGGHPGHPVILGGGKLSRLRDLRREPEGLRSLVRSLRPEGTLIPVEGLPRWDLNDPDDYRRALRKARRGPLS